MERIDESDSALALGPKLLNYDSVPLINDALSYFRTANLRMSAGEFQSRIEAYCADRIPVEERTRYSENQNIHMTKFHWGHDHDFGAFQVPGAMGTRHVWMLSRFFDHFGVSSRCLENRDVLDAGCWTGGVSLILNRLGCRVTAIDEIRKYTQALAFLAESFAVESLETRDLSIYDLGGLFEEKFDAVFCLGVIYHLSDPVLGLRRLYHAMKSGGLLCIESMAIPSQDCICQYEGPSRRRGEFGWNWFVPSPRAIDQWLSDAGFENIQVGDGLTPFAVTGEGDPMGPGRCFAVATKKADHRICVAGLSAAIE